MGTRIRLNRMSRGITLKELGKMCKMDHSSISRIENGKFSSHILTLKLIADKLEVDVKDFL